MTTSAMIASLVGLTASLFLATRSLRSHGLSSGSKLKMGLVWAVAIVVLAVILGRFAG